MSKTDLNARNRADLQSVLKTAAGRRVLWRILQAAQIHTHGFVPGDSHATAFHCGQRSIGLFLLEEIRSAAPAAYGQMRNEYESDTAARQKELEREQDGEI